MSKTNLLFWAAAVGAVWGAAAVRGQQVIQPSPAYYQSGGTYYQAVPAVPAAQPVYLVPAAQPAPVAQPVYYVPQAPAQLTLAPASAYVAEEADDDEEGIYWFWGGKWPGMSLGPKLGTTGIGLDWTFGVSRYVNLRLGFNYGSFNWSPEFGDVEYDMDVDLITLPLLVDIHPFANHFRISAGLYLQPGTGADIKATPDDNTQIGTHTYTPEVIGTLTGEIETAHVVAPYLGVGFGNSTDEEQLLTFMFDLGLVFQSYDASLDSNGAGMTAALDTFRNDLALEEKNIQKDVDDWKIFPVLTFGIAWHF